MKKLRNGTSEHRTPACEGRFIEITTLHDPYRIELCDECRAKRTRPHDETDDDGMTYAHIQSNTEAADRADWLGWSIVIVVAALVGAMLVRIFLLLPPPAL
jgi:hypothetical protein